MREGDKVRVRKTGVVGFVLRVLGDIIIVGAVKGMDLCAKGVLAYRMSELDEY